MAMQAGYPNNRKRSLENLDEDILARSTQPGVLSRLRTWRALAAVWELPAFPMTPELVRCLGASFKVGGYRSAALYYSAAVQYQVRELGEPVPHLVNHTIRDAVRSIKRGLGPGSLKDAFSFQALDTVEPADTESAFDMRNVHHFRDIMVVATFFMLREIELSAARSNHLSLEGQSVGLTIPLRKTNSQGAFDYRSLNCACGARFLSLCPWHAAERHILRLANRSDFRTSQGFPLCPDSHGRTPTKALVTDCIRSTLDAAGVSTTRRDSSGTVHQRFGGHCVRVSGAQFLATASVATSHIMLLGRWTSSAIERYTHLQVVPMVTEQALHGDAIAALAPPTVHSQPVPSTPAQQVHVVQQVVDSDGEQRRHVEALQTAHESLEQLVHRMKADVQALTDSVPKPETNFVVRCKSMVAHLGLDFERDNNPVQWRTKCGWQYGTSRFYRIPNVALPFRSCRKCFNLEDSSDDNAEVESRDTQGSSSDSGSSASIAGDD